MHPITQHAPLHGARLKKCAAICEAIAERAIAAKRAALMPV